MADPLIKCTLGVLSITYQGLIFEPEENARSINPAHTSSISRSIAGATAISGPRHVPGYIWTIALAGLSDFDIVDQTFELYAEYERQRIAGLKPKVLIEDTTDYFFEASPRTRALATGASEIATTTGIKYYAQFYAHFNENPPTTNIRGALVLQLEEAGSIVPA